MKESGLWKLFRAALKEARAHAHRVENVAGSGQPDVEACLGGVEAWVELKILRGGKLEFRASQLAWIRDRLSAGGRVYVLAYEGSAIVLYHGGVCFGTVHEPPEPVNGKKSFRVRPSTRYTLCQISRPYTWYHLLNVMFSKQPWFS